MLSELCIKNFAIIENLTIPFEKGLTVLSGETGAGKSIIIDAIHLLVGGRGSSEFVRYGEDKAEIEGLFLIDGRNHPIHARAQEFGLEVEEGMIVLRRDISKTGKSVCRINGKLVTIATLREIGGTLVDIHGQHEHQELMDENRHLSLLDQFGGETITTALRDYEAVFQSYEKAFRNLKALNENEQVMAHRIDLISFQLEEIQQADLKLNEDDELAEERTKLLNYTKIHESVNLSYSALQGDNKGLDFLGLAMNYLEDAASIDGHYHELAEGMSNSFYMIEDIMRKLRHELEDLEYDPERLSMIEDRLDEINRLKRKYGKTIQEIVQYGAKIEEELEILSNKETHIEQLQKELQTFKQDLAVEAKELTRVRKNCADKLTGFIHHELKELYMDKTIFEVRFHSDYEHFSQTGSDKVEFYLSANPGEPLKPLSKIASGGELSRIMLALKSIFSKHQGVTSIIFDEVDTGVSGRVAQAIAEKIYHVSVDSQVLCISHLPQVAAMADTHHYIAKETVNGRTRTALKKLNEAEKINEISRMISGVEITDLTQEHAKELLSLANEIKYV